MKFALWLPMLCALPLLGQDVKRGRALYRSSTCHVCHGPLGDGKGEATKQPKRAMKPAPAAFNVRLKHGEDLAAIIKSIRKGIPGTAMIGYEGIMTEEQIADLASFIQTFHRQKTGTGN